MAPLAPLGRLGTNPSSVHHIRDGNVSTKVSFLRHIDDHVSTMSTRRVNVSTALRRGYELVKTRPVSTNLAIDVCTTLRNVDTNIRKIPGTALRNLATGEAVYTPPDGEDRLRILLANWERFLYAEERLDPLIRRAIGHYQFEAIHPFEDGNGRTGRILNLLFLTDQALLGEPILFMSRAILRTKSTYYRLLLEVTMKGGWEAWLLYVLDVVDETSRWTTAKIRAIRQLLTQATTYIRAQAPKVYSRELVDIILQPTILPHRKPRRCRHCQAPDRFAISRHARGHRRSQHRGPSRGGGRASAAGDSLTFRESSRPGF